MPSVQLTIISAHSDVWCLVCVVKEGRGLTRCLPSAQASLRVAVCILRVPPFDCREGTLGLNGVSRWQRSPKDGT